MFNLRVFAYPDSKGAFFFDYPLCPKRLEVTYHAQRLEDDLEYPEYAWKIDFLFKLIIQDEQKTVESQPTIILPFSEHIVLCFGKEPSARDHFMEIDPTFPSELLGPLEGVGLLDVSTNVEHNGVKLVRFFSRWLEQ